MEGDERIRGGVGDWRNRTVDRGSLILEIALSARIRTLAVSVLARLAADPARGRWIRRCEVVGAALAEADADGGIVRVSPEEAAFLLMALREVHFGMILASDPEAEAVREGVDRIRAADDVFRLPRTERPPQPKSRRIRRPEVDPARLAEFGFRDAAHLEERVPRVDVFEFETREQMVDHYLFGMCGPFATALHDAYGWQVVGIFDPHSAGAPRHVACRTPDGLYADGRGAGMTKKELVGPYLDYRGRDLDVLDMRREDVVRIFARHPMVHATAREHVAVLVPDAPTRSFV